MRLIRIALLVALALAVSGCGAKKQAAASGGAEIVPATAPVFVSIDSNLSSDQWQQVDELLRKFPIRSEAVASLRSALEEEAGLDYEQDIEPALGDEIDLVWLDLADEGSNVVAVTKPKDADAFRRMIEKGNEQRPGHARLRGARTTGSSSRTRSRRSTASRSNLRRARSWPTTRSYKDALAELPDDALVHVYARGRASSRLCRAAFPG